MRVIDEGFSNESKMAKKKKRTLKISDEISVKNNAAETDKESLVSSVTDSAHFNGTEEENVVTTTNIEETIESILPKKCVHLKSGVNPSHVRKKMKQFSRRCENCSESDENDVVWLCLCCGHRGCGRYSNNQHALKHFEVQRSVQHSLVLNLNTSQVWCYICDNEVAADANHNLKQIVSEITNRLQIVGPETPKTSLEAPKSRLTPAENGTKSKSTKEKFETLPTSVKGLSNLGNTCFFNSVVQNLIQTQLLEEILENGLLVKGANVVLRPSTNNVEKLFNVEQTDEQKSKEFLYPPLTVTLNEDLGPLTQSLCSIFKEFKTGKSSVVNPNNLFGQVCKKAPRFKGFQQQDSHELLRYLLDALREEEQKRLRLSLLHLFNPNGSKKPDSVSIAEKQKLKAYDRAADVTCVEQVFGGQLVQSITCLECGSVSLKQESFLDLSLPIVENKDNTTVVVNKLGEDFLTSLGKPKTNGKSKHSLKKEKKTARKSAKGQVVNARRKSSSEQIPLIDETPTDPEPNAESLAPEATPENCSLNIVESIENLTLDERTNEDEDAKLDDTEASEDAQDQEPQTLNKYMEPLSSQEETKSGTCHLAACMRAFMSTETLAGKNQFGCEFCSKAQFSQTNGDVVMNENSSNKVKPKLVYTNALKQYLIFSPPAVLTLHLKRFHQVGGSFRKISKHVEFPTILDLSPYCSKLGKRVPLNGNRILYLLYGVVSHSGRLSGGHYVAFVKIREKNKYFTSTFLQSGPSTSLSSVDFNKNVITSQIANGEPSIDAHGKWYYISDGHVSETSESKVLSNEAYLLFYERIQ